MSIGADLDGPAVATGRAGAAVRAMAAFVRRLLDEQRSGSGPKPKRFS
jgi:hypothetical protein